MLHWKRGLIGGGAHRAKGSMVVLPIENGYSGKAQSDRREDREWDQCCWRKKKGGGGGARPTQLERESCTWRRGGGGGYGME